MLLYFQRQEKEKLPFIYNQQPTIKECQLHMGANDSFTVKQDVKKTVRTNLGRVYEMVLGIHTEPYSK